MTGPLEPVAADIWIAAGETVSFYGFPYPTRSVVVRLGSGGLWVWSPVRLGDELRRAVEALGPPQHLVSPNRIHHLYLAEWHAAFPAATLWGPASTIAKRRDLPFAAPLGDEPPPAWRGEIDQAWFRGSPLLDEVVFFHRASSTAILADLSENFSAAWLAAHWAPWQRWIARRWGIVEGEGHAPLEYRLSFLDRRALRTATARMLGWHPERVVMAHGVWQPSDGEAFLRRSFRWAL